MTNKHILLVCDADRFRGSGHVMRMITLGSALIELGAVVTLCAHTIPDSLRELAISRLINVVPRTTPQHDEELGQSLQVGDWQAVVFDGYEFASKTFSELHQSGHRVIVIDDNGDHSTAACSMIVNPNLHADASMYEANQSCSRYLLGADFALIRNDIRTQHIPDFEERSGIFLGVGGTDPLDLASRLSSALSNHRDWDIRRAQGVLSSAISATSEMGLLLSQSRIGLIAFGTTTWEALHLGLPIIGVIVADNQLLVAESVQKAHLADVFDCRSSVSTDEIVVTMTKRYGDSELLKERSLLGQQLVDGKGARRVADAILTST